MSESWFIRLLNLSRLWDQAASRSGKARQATRQANGKRWVVCIGCIAWRTGVGQSWAGTIWTGTFMLLVTGGAGFIGSNVVAALNDAGRADIAVGDLLGP